MVKRGNYRRQRSKRQRITSTSKAERREHNENRKHAAIFARERDSALLSMDKPTICAMWLKYKVAVPPAVLTSDALFLYTVHRMRTEIRSLPLDERRKSKKWLEANKLRSADKGEL